MKIIISNSSPTPIYEQIKEQIIKQIWDDELQENEILPSIRALAMDIKISVMTIKKAYDELEKEGYVKTVQGKGTFVALKSNNLAIENAKKEIEDHLIKAINLANKFEVSKKDLIDLIEIFYGSDK